VARHGKFDNHPKTALGTGRQLQSAAMGSRDRTDNRQPEAGTVAGRQPFGTDPMERFPE
jgi:hypothetical protein